MWVGKASAAAVTSKAPNALNVVRGETQNPQGSGGLPRRSAAMGVKMMRGGAVHVA